MEDIIYVDEMEKEEIFSGTYVIDGPISEVEQRNKILKMMEVAGVEVDDPDTLEIGFDGVEDDNGISETQTSPFHVFQTVVKKVPYRVTREEVFRGSLILDPIRMTPEEQNEKIYQMMRMAGVEVGDSETLEIGYEGVEDDNGISETQTAPFVVYRVQKTKLEEVPLTEEEKKTMEDAFQKIREEREKIEYLTNMEERKKAVDQLLQRIDELEKRVGPYVKGEKDADSELKEIELEIEENQKEIKKILREYEDSYLRMESILDEQESIFENQNYSAEELDALRSEFARRKMEENEKSSKLRKEIEEQKKRLTSLKRKKNKIEKDLGRAAELEVSLDVLKEIDDVLQKTKVMNAILEKKGLQDVVEKKATERSKEEKEKVKKAKEEVVKEVTEATKENENLSVLDAIEALYSVQVQYTQGKPPRVLLIQEDQLGTIKENANKVPERIIGDAKVLDYEPEDVPEDMVDVDHGYHREEVFTGTYILDGERMSEDQQRKKIFDMMRIAGIPVENEADFEIGYEGVEDDNGISETQSTKFVVYRKIKEEKKEEDDVVEKDIPSYEDSRGFDERIVFFRDQNHNGDIYVRDYVVKRFHLVPISEEVQIDESLCYQISEEDAEYIMNNQENNYSPYFIETRDITLPKENEDKIKEEVQEEVTKEEKPKTVVVIYHDVDNNEEKYAKQETIVRFNLIPLSDAVEIDGEAYYRVSDDDAAFVINNQQNQYSPYEVDYREAHLGKVMEDTPQETKSEERRELIETITLYRDLDNNNEVYVKKYVLSRFNLVPVSEEVRIDGAPCYRIDNEDASYIIMNANNHYSPYEVEVEDVELGKRVVVDDLITKLERKDLVEKIVLYRDLDNNNDIYVKKYVVTRFNLQPTGPEVRIMKAACYKIDPEDADFIIGNAHNSYSPYEIDIVDVNLGKTEEMNRSTTDHEGLVEKMKIYRHVGDHNRIYAKKYTLYRFNLDPMGDACRIDGFLCYPISEEDALYIYNNQRNGYSPYELEIKNIDSIQPIDEEEEKRIREGVLRSQPNPTEPPKEEEEVVEEYFEMPQVKYAPPVIPDPTEVKKDEEEVFESFEIPQVKYAPPVMPDPTEVKVDEEEEDEKKGPKEENLSDEIVLYRDPNHADQLYTTKDILMRFAIFPTGSILKLGDQTYYPIRLEDEKRIREFIQQFMPNTELQYRVLPIEITSDVTPKAKSNEPPTYEGIMEKLFIPDSVVGARRYTASDVRPTALFMKELNEGDWAYNIVHYLSCARMATKEFLRKISEKLLGTKEGKDSIEELRRRVSELSDEELEVLLKEFNDSRGIRRANQVVDERLQEYLRTKLAKYETDLASQYEEMFNLIGKIRVLEESLMDSNLDKELMEAYVEERKDLLEEASSLAQEMMVIRDDIKSLTGGHSFDDMPDVVDRYSFATMRNKGLSQEYQNRFDEFQRNLGIGLNNHDAEQILANFLGAESCYYENSDVAVRMVGARSVGTKYYSPLIDEFSFKDDEFSRDLFRYTATSSAIVHNTEKVRLRELNSYKKIDNTNYSIEVEELDMSNWHHSANASYEAVQEINRIMTLYNGGTFTEGSAIEQLGEVGRNFQRQLINLVNEMLQILKPYSDQHLEFDYKKTEQALEQVISYPDSVALFDSGHRDVIGEVLYILPKEMISNLISYASAVELVNEVRNGMMHRYSKVNDFEYMSYPTKVM